MCDKSYISQNKKDMLKEERIALRYPHRKNMVKKTPKINKKLLKKRYTIENTIRNCKRFRRVLVRSDKYIHTYMSFVYLAIINLFTNSRHQKCSI